jgi:uncharacterized protein (TIGR02145 family)
MRHRLRFVEANASMVMPGNGNQSNVLALLKQNLIKKSMLLLVTLLIFTSVTLMAQSPQKINFQSIVRNTNGVIFSNKTLSIKISLLSGSATGEPVYSETHSSTTDAIGLVSLQIGSGTALSGSFATINWGNTAHFIKLEADFTGGNAYVTLGTQELMSVPYAMYAAKTDTASLNLTNRFAAKLNKSDFPSGNSPGEFMYWNGDFWTTLPRGQRGESIIIDQNGNPTWGCLIPSSATMPSTIPTIAVNKPMTPITIATTGVTGITDYNLPPGLQASWIANVITISGIPTLASTFQYIFVLSVNCGQPLVVLGTIEVTPATVPDPPTGVVATAGDGSASVAFVAPTNDGGSDITLYLVLSDPPFISSPGNGYSATSPIIVTGLTNGTPYTFTVTARNDVGPSNPSAPSAAVTPAPPPSACPDPTVTDIDGNVYNTVGIGNQCWTKENLRVSSYNDGTLISVVTDNDAWTQPLRGIRSWYNNDSTTNEIPYGNLYNWYAVKGINYSISTDAPIGYIYKNICPTGWHVPTDAEWTTLTNTLEGESVAGGKMKSTGTTYWNSESTGTNNSSGFSALPGGIRESDGSFYDIRNNAAFWSATGSGESAWYRFLNSQIGGVAQVSLDKRSGFSVRCLKDSL